ncbi:hypothetical protein [Aeromonas sp. D3]|uniref:hypothetical protein n=1 Tax=Aeromonas sp. D3 TaxID=2990474 RepID=UPI0022E32DAC|nr:hypothetical protein [Aeromonas sp. D3]
MADFSRWLAGLEAVLKIPHGQLQKAYQYNVEQSTIAGVIDDSLFVALTHFAKRYPKASPWSGTPHNLLSALESQTVISLGNDMPKSAAAMSRKLPALMEALANNGVYLEKGKASERYCKVWFQPRGAENADDATSLSAASAEPPLSAEADEADEADIETLLA